MVTAEGAAVTAESPVLGARELNRALLARQHLLTRTGGGAVATVGHLVGLQAQNPPSPYPALWSRLDGFDHDELSQALHRREVARIVVMRGTIHLVTAEDALTLPALVAPLLTRALRTNPTFARPLRDVDLDLLAAAARDLVEAEPMAAPVLGAHLARRWPEVDPAALAYAARGMLPLVQVTPRGMWGRSGRTTWTTSRAWLGREPADLGEPALRRDALRLVALRYFAAFGPASVADLQYWCGLTGLRDVVESLRPQLVPFRAGSAPGGRPGRELFDVPDAPRPGAGAEAPIRFLPDYDNLTIAHADRGRIVSEDHRRRFVSPNGVGPGKVLLDGMAAGTWSVAEAKAKEQATGDGDRRTVATLTVVPFTVLGPEERERVAAEAEGLVRFMVPTAREHRVVLRPAVADPAG